MNSSISKETKVRMSKINVKHQTEEIKSELKKEDKERCVLKDMA